MEWNALDEFIREERGLLHREFVAPVLKGGKIRVQVGGMTVECSNRSSFAGWGIFHMERDYSARFIRQAEIWEKEEFRQRCRSVPLFIFFMGGDGVRWAVHRERNTYVPVYLAENMMMFDLVTTVFDGANYWFFEEHPENDPAKTHKMRVDLQRGIDADSLKIRGMKPFDYEMFRMASLIDDNSGKNAGRRIERALSMGGAELLNFAETESGFLINWRKMGREISTMTDRKLSVVSAGYCLSGEDGKQDLTSLASLTGRQW